MGLGEEQERRDGQMPQSVASEGEFARLVSQTTNSPLLVHFFAEWCEPCKQMDAVLDELHAKFPPLVVARVEAEEMDDVAEKYEIESVPTCILFWNQGADTRIDGAHAQELTAATTAFFSKHATLLANLPQAPPSAAREEVAAAERERIMKLVCSAPVMLFMKGQPDAPRCGFSRQMVDLLRTNHVVFNHFDILTDEGVRQNLKKIAEWPTYPQLYVNGELLGGIDIVKGMVDDGSFLGEIPEDCQEAKLHARLQQLIAQSPVMLFMKGEPDNPRCGFSRKIVDVLRANNVRFGSFDILSDWNVRQGLKKLSDWPTYPQLYAGGELVGGLDIVNEMVADGSFKSQLPKEALA